MNGESTSIAGICRRPWKVCGSGSSSVGAFTGTGSVTVVVVVDVVVVAAVAAVAPTPARTMAAAAMATPERTEITAAESIRRSCEEAALTARADACVPGETKSGLVAAHESGCGRRSVLAEPQPVEVRRRLGRRPLGVGDAGRHADAPVARSVRNNGGVADSMAASQRRWPGRYCGNASGQRLAHRARLHVGTEMPTQFAHRRVDETASSRWSTGSPSRPSEARTTSSPSRRCSTSASRRRRP